MSYAYPWPVLLRPRVVTFSKAFTARSGGQSLSGTELVVASNAGRWQAELTIPVNARQRQDQVLALRALSAQLQGRVGEVLVPVYDVCRPRDVNGRIVGGHGAVSLDGETLWDLVGLGQTEPVYAEASALAPLGATQISINVLSGEGLRPGHYFGVGERLHVASHAYRDEPDDPQIVRFWPPLREAVSIGTQILFGTMVCRMRQMEDSSADAALDFLRFGEVTLRFEEAV